MSVQEIVSRICFIPPMPSMAAKLAHSACDPNADLAEVASMIERDPAMTANLLRLCNSSYYGFSKEITSVRQATGLFGLKKISHIAISVLSSGYLIKAQSGYGLSAGDLWRHSIVVAHAAELLAKRTGYADRGAAFTGGLLHDIGKILISDFVYDVFNDIEAHIGDGIYGFDEAEKELLGINHAEAGGLLLTKWQFPDRLIEAVKTHHNPRQASIDANLATIVQAADAVSLALGIGMGCDGFCYKYEQDLLSEAKISPHDVEWVIAKIGEKLNHEVDILTPPEHKQ